MRPRSPRPLSRRINKAVHAATARSSARVDRAFCCCDRDGARGLWGARACAAPSAPGGGGGNTAKMHCEAAAMCACWRLR